MAVGLGLKRADRKSNAGWLIFAALLPDFMLGWFALAGWDGCVAPADYASTHYLLFDFAWSHSLLAHVVWAAIAGLVAWGVTRRRVASFAAGAATLSHFLLDGIVHVKGLPLAMSGGPAFGLGLWRFLPAELSLEVAMAAAGLWMYWLAVKDTAPRRAGGMAIYIAALTAFLVAGQASASQAPPRGALIASWILGTPAMAAIALLLDRRRERSGEVA